MAANSPKAPPEQPQLPSSAAALEQHTDAGLANLRTILLREDRAQIADLATRLALIERRTSDDEALVATITPVLGDLIRRKVRDGRDEMVEALYPIIGQLVIRAVGEAMRDLARNIDFQLRTSLSLRGMLQRLRARLRGVSDSELLLRQALPYSITDIFLIHRESGLLLGAYADRPADPADSDLISAMLTAIRDFAHDAFGRGGSGQLDEIQYGDQRILIEAAQHAYLAVVVEGIEPPGYRSRMREQLIAIEHAHAADLRSYAGDAAVFADAQPRLHSLAATAVAAAPPPLGAVHKGVLAVLGGTLIACVALTWVVGAALRQPRPVPHPALVVLAQPAPPTPLPPISTPQPSPTPAPTATPTRTPTPALAMMSGDVFLHIGPGEASARIGVVIERGQPIEILDLQGSWYRVRWRLPGNTEVIGWTPSEWVATATPQATR